LWPFLLYSPHKKAISYHQTSKQIKVKRYVRPSLEHALAAFGQRLLILDVIKNDSCIIGVRQASWVAGWKDP
jgi:hypothetical protein